MSRNQREIGVRTHQTIGMDRDHKQGVDLAYKGQVHLSVLVIPKDVSVSNASVHRVVLSTRIFVSH